MHTIQYGTIQIINAKTFVTYAWAEKVSMQRISTPEIYLITIHYFPKHQNIDIKENFTPSEIEHLPFWIYPCYSYEFKYIVSMLLINRYDNS